jgi:hypothetical protein
LTNRTLVVNRGFIGDPFSLRYHTAYTLMSVPTCIIAGAEPDLALAVSERFAREGFAVYVIDCEPRNSDSVETAIRAIETRAGACDVLVYNAFIDGVRVSYAELADVLALVTRRAAVMQAKQGGALVFATYEFPESQLQRVRKFVDALADEIEPAGIRVGIVTIAGSLPTDAAELASIADVYWDVFFCAEQQHRRERRVRTSRPFRA